MYVEYCMSSTCGGVCVVERPVWAGGHTCTSDCALRAAMRRKTAAFPKPANCDGIPMNFFISL